MINVLILGNTNVGKSSLFNEFFKKKLLLVSDDPYTTRDIFCQTINDITIYDGGTFTPHLGKKKDILRKNLLIFQNINFKINILLKKINIIIFIIDSIIGPNDQDYELLSYIRKFNKIILFVVNKIDLLKKNFLLTSDLNPFFQFANKKIFFISCKNKLGINSLFDEILNLKNEYLKLDDLNLLSKNSLNNLNTINICFLGQPNVGKSSLINALLKKDKMIVNEMSGTTRDNINNNIVKHKKLNVYFNFCDTAGIVLNKNINIHHFFLIKKAMNESDIIFIVFDIYLSFSKKEKILLKNLIQYIGKPFSIIINKSDLLIQKNIQSERLLKSFVFLPHANFILTSAKNNNGLNKIFENAYNLYNTLQKKISTHTLNKTINNIMNSHKPNIDSNTRKQFKIYYAVQTNKTPIIIKFFCNNIDLLKNNYKQYLKNQLIKQLNLTGFIIKLIFINK